MAVPLRFLPGSFRRTRAIGKALRGQPETNEDAGSRLFKKSASRSSNGRGNVTMARPDPETPLDLRECSWLVLFGEGEIPSES
jgi:hypothetical protein